MVLKLAIKPSTGTLCLDSIYHESGEQQQQKHWKCDDDTIRTYPTTSYDDDDDDNGQIQVETLITDQNDPAGRSLYSPWQSKLRTLGVTYKDDKLELQNALLLLELEDSESEDDGNDTEPISRNHQSYHQKNLWTCLFPWMS